jgi:hypothetical protein
MADWMNLYFTLKLDVLLVLTGKNIFYSDKYGTLYQQYFKSLHTLITHKKVSIHGQVLKVDLRQDNLVTVT